MRMIDADVLKLGIISQSNTGREDYSTELVCEFIDEQPTVGEWISVSESGYPKNKGWYQCTCDDRNVGNQIWPNHTIVCNLFWNPNMNEFIDNIRYSENGHKDIEKYFWTKHVTAWQPLPKPYQPKGESHE